MSDLDQDDFDLTLQAAELAELGEELEEYDLLDGAEGEDDANLELNIKSTVGAFSSRFQRKIAEKEKKEDAIAAESRVRHVLMFEVLTSIRRSLWDVCRINLGERFEFVLVTDDWHGWPRMTIQLHDYHHPEAEHPPFRVTPHDRNQRGTIEIQFADNQVEKLQLIRPTDVKSLPKTLKKCVRGYLDFIGDTILQLESPVENDDQGEQLSKQSSENFDEKPKAEVANSLDADVFQDETFESDIFEALPTASGETVQSLDVDLDAPAPSVDADEQRATADTPSEIQAADEIDCDALIGDLMKEIEDIDERNES